jgi:hypothetical protein
MRKDGDPAMVPALVRAARANIADVWTQGRADLGMRSRLNDLHSRMVELETWMPRHRDQPLRLAPRLDPDTAHSTRIPPESERVYVRDGLLLRANTNRPLEPSEFDFWSYVVDEHGNFYVVEPLIGHRPVLGDDGRVAAAGMLVIARGRPGSLLHMNTHSGGFPDGNLRQLQQLVEALGLNLDHMRDWLDDGRHRVVFPNSVRAPKHR